MDTKERPPRQRSSVGRGPQPGQRPDRAHRRAAEAHERSAEIFERHALLLDRYGAHRSAMTERRHADEERDAAKAALQNLARQPGSGHAAVGLHG
jgi:hypothetical protein